MANNRFEDYDEMDYGKGADNDSDYYSDFDDDDFSEDDLDEDGGYDMIDSYIMDGKNWNEDDWLNEDDFEESQDDDFEIEEDEDLY